MALPIFVYGTLKRAQPNYYRLLDTNNGRAKFLGEARLVDKYPLVVASLFNLPVLLGRKGEGKDIFGELYEVDDKMLQHLDWLENHPSTYTRTPVQAIMRDQSSTTPSPVDCEVYMVFNFKPHLLSFPFLSSYEDTPDKKYRSKHELKDGVPSLIEELKQ